MDLELPWGQIFCRPGGGAVLVRDGDTSRSSDIYEDAGRRVWDGIEPVCLDRPGNWRDSFQGHRHVWRCVGSAGGRLDLWLSTFVLQLLKDKDHLGSEYGHTSFGVMLLQYLTVVRLLVDIPILAGDNKSMGEALALSSFQAVAALGIIPLFGKLLLKPLFGFVSASGSN